ncbi:MAG TPA: D-glycero-beta-D-manno-heptose 1-phosphate adenylyltransferase [Syntrophales bacterium]|jgi:D-beta-D-heptose 7-phosphate kinase/D-beta-D-heptose 1-phosphate adenosyltransferase|nr:D-glycero-beta-D-manno-heptose 1-phosphate adenylyltransferase [Syntrophales bacterium]HQG34293.1 D-glycero-beta-D-manno-heptose 1-phosphate adenylyltransferase [Syntrophales bacterium]
MGEIVTKEQLKERLRKLREEGKTIVFTNGCFDILHVGHVRYLREAGKLGDVLILGLNSDASVRSIKGEKRPLVPEDERADIMAALACVDYVVIFPEPTPQELIEYLQPDVLVKGNDWQEDAIAGAAFVKAAGGRVVTIPLTVGRSTTNIVEKIRQLYG